MICKITFGYNIFFHGKVYHSIETILSNIPVNVVPVVGLVLSAAIQSTNRSLDKSVLYMLGVGTLFYDDVIKWKHFPRYWSFGQWRGASMFSFIFVRTNNWGNNGDARDLRRHRAHYDVIVMYSSLSAKVCSRFHTLILDPIRMHRNGKNRSFGKLKCISPLNQHQE